MISNNSNNSPAHVLRGGRRVEKVEIPKRKYNKKNQQKTTERVLIEQSIVEDFDRDLANFSTSTTINNASIDSQSSNSSSKSKSWSKLTAWKPSC